MSLFDLFDFLFTPFEFVHQLIEYLQKKLATDDDNHDEESSAIDLIRSDAKKILTDLIKCSIETSKRLNEILDRSDMNDSMASQTMDALSRFESTTMLRSMTMLDFSNDDASSSVDNHDDDDDLNEEERTTLTKKRGAESFYSSSLSFTATTINISNDLSSFFY